TKRNTPLLWILRATTIPKAGILKTTDAIPIALFSAVRTDMIYPRGKPSGTTTIFLDSSYGPESTTSASRADGHHGASIPDCWISEVLSSREDILDSPCGRKPPWLISEPTFCRMLEGVPPMSGRH